MPHIDENESIFLLRGIFMDERNMMFHILDIENLFCCQESEKKTVSISMYLLSKRPLTLTSHINRRSFLIIHHFTFFLFLYRYK